MENFQITNENVLYFIVRVILGVLFFFQGFDKVFKLKMGGLINFFRQELGTLKVPPLALKATAWFTSYAELICGALLILGLFKTYAIYILGIDLIIVSIAFSIIKPIWDMNIFFPRLILLCILLFLPADHDILSLDYLMQRMF